MTDYPRIQPSARRIEILAYDDAQLLDIAGPLAALSSANPRWASLGPPYYETAVVSRQGGIIVTSAGLAIATNAAAAYEAAVDTLIVPGGRGIEAALHDRALLEWVRWRAARARRVASVCTGAFILGAAGLLDGRRATTHWARCTALATRFPRVRVEPDPIFVQDGHVWTSAGVTAGIDLTLALIEQDLGRPKALAVARALVMFVKRPGGQAQFSAPLTLQQAEDRFATLHGWISANLGAARTVADLADHMGMSERTFSRHYRAATGITPAKALESLRLTEARRMLEDTDLSVKEIALRCGFGAMETMRKSFLRALGVAPQDYRQRFHADTGSRVQQGRRKSAPSVVK